MKHNTILFLFAAAALLSSCSLFEKASLNVTPTISQISNQSTTVQLKLATNQEWTLTSNQDWATPNISAGVPADTLIKVRISANNDYDERTATLTFSCGKCDPVCVTITQAQKNAILSDINNKEFDDNGGTFDVTVQSNVTYSVKISQEAQSWLTAVTTKGLTSTSYSFNVAANPNNEDRRGSIILSNNDGTVNREISVYQKGKTFAMSVTHHNLAFTVPLLEGLRNVEGTIRWGDSSEEEYNENAKHSYAAEGTYTTGLECIGVSSVFIPDVVGITEISFDKY